MSFADKINKIKEEDKVVFKVEELYDEVDQYIIRMSDTDGKNLGSVMVNATKAMDRNKYGIGLPHDEMKEVLINGVFPAEPEGVDNYYDYINVQPVSATDTSHALVGFLIEKFGAGAIDFESDATKEFFMDKYPKHKDAPLVHIIDVGDDYYYDVLAKKKLKELGYDLIDEYTTSAQQRHFDGLTPGYVGENLMEETGEVIDDLNRGGKKVSYYTDPENFIEDLTEELNKVYLSSKEMGIASIVEEIEPLEPEVKDKNNKKFSM